MELIDEKKLIWTPVVANCRMNRERNLAGINSYEKDLDFNILEFIKEGLTWTDNFYWVDLCCGEGKAIYQAYQFLKNEENVFLEGIDLVDMFDKSIQENDNLKLEVKSIIEWNPSQKYDLITCVHGLHYIGDKLLVIEKIASYLKEKGKFIGNIDFDNLRDKSNKPLKSTIANYLKKQSIIYNNKEKVLTIEGYKKLKFNFNYIGADINAGKNYTGQEVVNSIYNTI